jgi:hypothetical protein
MKKNKTHEYKGWKITKLEYVTMYGVEPPAGFKWHTWVAKTVKEAKASIDKIMKGEAA